MNLTINVHHKISSLLRRGEPFYALSFSWDNRELVVHQTQQDYFQEIVNIRDTGMAKRSQCYVDRLIQFGGKQYVIYLISFGDIRKWKMTYGENPIAKSFNVCMLDFVFMFVETKQFASKKIQIRLKQLHRLGRWHDYYNMRKSAQNLFGGHSQKENSSNTQISRNSNLMKNQYQEN